MKNVFYSGSIISFMDKKASCHLERVEKRPFFKRLFSNCCAFLNSEREYRFPFTKMVLVFPENSINNKRLAINQNFKQIEKKLKDDLFKKY